MSTTQETTQTGSNQLQFNPIAQGIYDQLVKGGGNTLLNYIQSPFNNSFYNLASAQSQKGAQQAGANNMAALQQNILTSGLGGQGGAGFKAAQTAQTGRANQAMSSQANIQNVLAALQRQMAAAGTGLSFSPQMTGSTSSSKSTTKESGLGTWLPQLLGGLASAGMGAASAGMMGTMQPSSFGSVGGVSNPALGSISAMPSTTGLAGMGSGGLTGLVPGGNSQTPFPYSSIFGR